MYDFISMPIDTKIKVTQGSGLDSGKTGHVCQHFSNNDSYEMRLKSDGWVPVDLNGNKTYLPESVLLQTNKEYKMTIENEVIVYTEQ